jgi:hypothetical protein
MVESHAYMFNCLYRACQKSETNWLPQSDTIELGSLCSLKIYLTKHLATETVLIESMGTIYRIFIKWSTTTIIFVNLLLLGKSTTKSIEISRHLCIGIGNS